LGIAFIGGLGPGSETLRKIAEKADILVAADSGLIAVEEAGLRPDWVLGDMDSLDYLTRLEKYPPERVRRYPFDKDYTDTELALTLLREKGCDEVWLSGGGGSSDGSVGRIDHLFAIHSLFERGNPPDRWFTRNEEIHCLKEGRAVSAHLAPMSLVSVFPLGEGLWEAESSGLKWPLNDLAWERGGFSVSNLAEKGPFEIRSKRGRFMVIMEKEQ
jgi:thiamine pyrophosphokinase